MDVAAVPITLLDGAGLAAVGDQYLTLSFAISAIGRCTDRVSRLEGSALVFNDGTRSQFVAGSEGRLRMVHQDRQFTLTRHLDCIPSAARDGRSLISAARVDSSVRGSGAVTTCVGLWRDTRSGYAVRGFTVRDGRLVAEPRTILTTQRPVRAVSYRPSSDAQIRRA